MRIGLMAVRTVYLGIVTWFCRILMGSISVDLIFLILFLIEILLFCVDFVGLFVHLWRFIKVMGMSESESETKKEKKNIRDQLIWFHLTAWR